MDSGLGLTSRKGLAQILNVTDRAALYIERRGEIAPVAVIDGRPLFSVAQAEALKAKRDAAHRARAAGRGAEAA